MKEVEFIVGNGEIWLRCPDHGLVRCFGEYALLSDLVTAEQEHAILHMREMHDLTAQKGS